MWGGGYGGVWNAGGGGLLDDGNVDGGGSARGVDLGVVGHAVIFWGYYYYMWMTGREVRVEEVRDNGVCSD